MSLTEALLLDPYPMDVWIALRTDGLKGSGTEDDPYDGSTRGEVAKSVSSITRSGNVATATVTSHGLSNGEVVEITGVTGPDEQLYEGRFPIYNKTNDTFDYVMKGTPTGSAGGASIKAARVRYLFDEVMQALLPAPPTPTPAKAIHLGPGTFETRGYTPGAIAWQPRSGLKLHGSGIRVTTLKLVQASVRHQVSHAIGAEYNNFLEEFEASDFTVDCNLPGQPMPKDQPAGNPFALIGSGAISVPGKHVRIRRIRAINFGTQSPDVECFVLVAAGAHPNIEAETPPKIPIDCVIEDCIVEQPSLNNVRETTCINMAAGEPLEGAYAGIMAYHDACVVRRCLVNCEYQVNPLPIKAISTSGTTATAETWVPHGREVGQRVRVSGKLFDGSIVHPFTGSFLVTAKTDTTFSYTMASTPVASPAGEFWLDKFPSHRVDITSLTRALTGPGEYTVTVTTLLPHFLAEGSLVAVSNVFAGSFQNAYNGAFPVASITNASTFTYKIASDPGAPDSSSAFIGVSFQAISNDGGTGAVVEYNQVLHARVGVYHDFYSSRDLTVRDNTFIDVEAAVQQQLGGVSGVQKAALSLTQTGPPDLIATFTAASIHGLRAGDAVVIENADPPGFNGFYEVTAISPTDPKVFNYVLRASPGSGSATGASFRTLWQERRLAFERNVVELTPSVMVFGPPNGLYLVGGGLTAPGPHVFLEVLIRQNVFRHFCGQKDFPGYPFTTAVYMDSCRGAIIERNTIDLEGPGRISISACGSVRLANNLTPRGQQIFGTTANIGSTREPAADIELAELLSL